LFSQKWNLRRESPALWHYPSLSQDTFKLLAKYKPLVKVNIAYTYIRVIHVFVYVYVCLPASHDWCCFYYFIGNSLVALPEALSARIFLDLPHFSVLLPLSPTPCAPFSPTNTQLIVRIRKTQDIAARRNRVVASRFV